MSENARLTSDKNNNEHTSVFRTLSHIYDRAFFEIDNGL